VRRGAALLLLFVTLAFVGEAAAAWQTGTYVGQLRSPGYGKRPPTPITLSVTKTQIRVLSAKLSWNCPGAKNRVAVTIGPLKPVKIRVRPDTGGAQFTINQKVAEARITIVGGITPGKPLQGLLDATREIPLGICTDSALFTAKPR
jgi:hypothetical protein